MMSTPNLDPAHWNLASPAEPKASQIDSHLRVAIDNAQPIRLRRTLQELCQTLPNAHKVTAALLLATQKRYIEKIEASKGTESDEEEEEDNEGDEDESEGDGASVVEEISELSSEEEDDDEDSDNGSDDDVERSEFGSEEEDDQTDKEGGSTTTSTWHMSVKSEMREKD